MRNYVVDTAGDDPNQETPHLPWGSAPYLGGDQGRGPFGSLWWECADVFFPVKLPPLVLESEADPGDRPDEDEAGTRVP